MDNLTEQCEEIEALVSIYGEDWKMELEENCYSMKITPNVKLFITLTSDYPSNSPPKFELLAPTLSSQQKNYVSEEFRNIYETNKGSPILFQWIEKLRDIVGDNEVELNNTNNLVEEIIEKPKSPKKEINLKITHGEIIQDRKSTFQGHACEIHSQEDTKIFMDFLLENKKVAQATHNISAYRIQTEKSLLQDCDDDGETHAGGRLLHLLQILNLNNVMVVVSRWYGGIQLGPDRFKHINNAARQVLVKAGFLPS